MRFLIRVDFDRVLWSWATKHGIPRNTVNGVLQGKLKGKRGHAHNAAVLPGLKDGVVNCEDTHELDLYEVLPVDKE